MQVMGFTIIQMTLHKLISEYSVVHNDSLVEPKSLNTFLQTETQTWSSQRATKADTKIGW